MTGATHRVADEVAELLDTESRILIGLTGPPGAGKTTLARNLAEQFAERLGPPAVGRLPMDGFHLSNAALDRLGRRDRKGAPDTFDVAGFVTTLARLVRATEDVYVPDFDHSVGEPIAASGCIPASARLVLVEGNYLALNGGRWSEVAPLLHRIYFVDADPGVRRNRLLRRHRAAGKSEDAARNWIATVDEPNAQLIAATKHRCDRVIGGD